MVRARSLPDRSTRARTRGLQASGRLSSLHSFGYAKNRTACRFRDKSVLRSLTRASDQSPLPPLSGRCLLICHPANMRIHSAYGVFGGVRVTSFEGRFRKWFTTIAILVVVFLLGLSATRHNGRPRFASAFGTRSLFDCS